MTFEATYWCYHYDWGFDILGDFPTFEEAQIALQNYRPEAWEDADRERTLSDGTWIKEGYHPGGHGVVYEFWIVPR